GPIPASILARSSPLAQAPSAQHLRRLFFGEFSAEIDASGCRTLFRGTDPVALSEIPREVLFMLLKHRPRPVTGKRLLNEIWHHGANPSNVAKQVRALRQELGDMRAGRYIRTLKKEGYAFVMPVTESPCGPPPEAQLRIDVAAVSPVSASVPA